MGKFYSKSAGGFFDESVHGTRNIVQEDGSVEPNPACKIPLDAVEISDELHAALLEGQSAGKLIVADEGGAPVLAERPIIPFSERREAYFNEEVRALRDIILNRLVGIGWVVNGDDVTMVEAIKRARVDLLDITKHPTVLAATTMTDLRQAVKLEYKRIVAAAPASLRSAFNGMSA